MLVSEINYLLIFTRVDIAGEKFVAWNQLDAKSFCELGKLRSFIFTIFLHSG